MKRSTLLLLAGFLVISASALGAPEKKPAAPCTLGSYQLVHTRGKVRVVVVSPACRTLKAMRALGDRLRSDFLSEQMVIVAIFDDARAASMYDRMVDSGGSLDADSDLFYDKHSIGNYTKNSRTGHHVFTIWLQGGSGPQTDIQY